MIDMHPIRQERERRGWSQTKLAKLLGTSAVSVSQWERRLFTPSPYFSEQLCSLFGKDTIALGLHTKARINGGVQSEVLLDPLIPISSLPSYGLVGREAFVSSLIKQFLASPSHQTLSLHGLPGVGKTALALTLTQNIAIQGYFLDGILWASLGPSPDLLAHLHRWCHLLKFPFEDSPLCTIASLAERLRIHIGSRRFLVILDDVWSLDDALALHIGGPKCHHVVTTRSPRIAVNLGSTLTIRVPELEMAQGCDLLGKFLPITLLQAPAALEMLVSRVGMLPLALTIIGKFLYSYEQVEQPRRLYAALHQLGDLQACLRLAVPQSAVDHHSCVPASQSLSLEKVIAASYYRLSKQEQEALRILSLLPAKPESFSEEIALALTNQPAEVLDTLYDAGLLESEMPECYTLHPTIAEYVRMQGVPDKALPQLTTPS